MPAVPPSVLVPPDPGDLPTPPGPRSLGGVLVVSRDAARRPHQVRLLQVVRLLRARGVEVALVLWDGGPLLGDLRATGADVQVVDELHEWAPGRFLQRLGRHRSADRLRAVRLRWRLWRTRRRHPVVYVHGERAARLLAYLVGERVVVLHLPEAVAGPAGEVELLPALSPPDAALVLARVDGVVVPDAALVAPAVAATGLDPDRVRSRADYGDVEVGRDRLDLPPGARVLVGLGTADWWRAPDPLVPLLWRLVRRAPELDLHLVWLCPADDPDVLWPLRHDLATAGLDDRVHLVSAGAPLDHLVLADVVLGVGRAADVEPYGADLVLAGRPVVVSDEGSVAAELDGLATVTPYLDVEAAAEAVLALLDRGRPPDGPGGRTGGWSGAGELLDAVAALAALGRRPASAGAPGGTDRSSARPGAA